MLTVADWLVSGALSLSAGGRLSGESRS